MMDFGPQSPIDIKPDSAHLLIDGLGSVGSWESSSPTVSSSLTQPTFTIGHSGYYPAVSSTENKNDNSGPLHPLGNSKHMCSICGDRASGKHYSVYSCEGCKGFFKRTIRKELTYTCREVRQCLIDRRQRNRCQYCRYQKCLSMGMKKEAVQEERQRGKEKGDGDIEIVNADFSGDMPAERLAEAEHRVECKEAPQLHSGSVVNDLCQATDKQLFQLVEWAKLVPHFADLPLMDQVMLIKTGWVELHIASFAHRSVGVTDGIKLGSGLIIPRHSAHCGGFGPIFDRVLTELVGKMRDIKMDLTELSCLKAIVLFNPDAKGLKAVQQVEALRERVYVALEEYSRTTYPDESGRFAKLLLRLPVLRSIGLKALDQKMFLKLIGDVPIDSFLMEMLETPV